MPSASSFAEVLSTSDPATGTELLLNLIAEASSGRDISSAVPSIIEAVFGRASTHPVIKKLTYDLCKAATYISDADCEFLASAIKVDVGGSHPDLAVAALRFLPSLPPSQLGQMQAAGGLDSVLLPALQHREGNVRAAGVASLHRILLCPAVVEAAAAATGPAFNYQERWVRLADRLLDEDPLAVGATAAALCELLEAAAPTADGGAATAAPLPGLAGGVLGASPGAGAGACGTASLYIIRRAAGDVAARVAAALGPVLETCAFVPAPDQAAVARLLMLLAQHLLLLHRAPRPVLAPAAPSSSAANLGSGSSLLLAGSGAAAAPGAAATAEALPPLGSVLPTLCEYLHRRLGSLDMAVRLECARSLLCILSLIHDARSTGDLAASSALVPEVWAMSAVSALLELQHRHLVEAGLPDAVMAIAHNLAALPVTVRQNAVRQLLPLVSQLNDVPCRMEAYTLVWNEVLQDEMRAKMCGGSDAACTALSLSALLSDPYVASLIKGTLGGGAFGGRSSGDKGVKQSDPSMPHLASGSSVALTAGGPRPVAEGTEHAPWHGPWQHADGDGQEQEMKEEEEEEVEVELRGMGAGAPRSWWRQAGKGAAGARHGSAGRGRPGPVAEGKEDGGAGGGSSGGSGGFFKSFGLGGKKEAKGAAAAPTDGGAAGAAGQGAASGGGGGASGSGGGGIRGAMQAVGQGAKGAAAAMAERTSAAGRAVLDTGRSAADRTSAAGRAAADGAATVGHGTAAAGRGAAEQAAAAGRTVAGGAAVAVDKTGGVLDDLLSLGDAPGGYGAPNPAAAAAAEGPARGRAVDGGADGVLGQARAAVGRGVAAAADGVGARGAIANTLVDLVAGVPSEIPKRLQSLNTHRHELLVTLLDATHRHAQECEVLEVCLAAQDAERRDIPASVAAESAVGDPARDLRLVHWVRTARAVLVATQACVAWEPLVTPAITTQLSSDADGHAAADFSSVPPDCWLQLLQAACHAARAAGPLLRARAGSAGPAGVNGVGAPGVNGVEATATSGLATAPSIASTATNLSPAPSITPTPAPALAPAPPPAPPAAPGSPAALSAELEQEGRELQVLLRQVLRSWGSLSRPARMRVAWVAAHYCVLPPAVDETWELVLKAIADTMSRSGSALRLNELMASASLGILFRSERQSWPRDKPFVFDIVAASALCERPDLELSSLFVGLSCLQHLAALLHNHLAAAAAAVAEVPGAAAAAAVAEVPGAGAAAAVNVKQVQADIVLVAARLEAMARDAQSPEVAASPQLKEWVGRIMRMCGALSCYQPPAGPSRRRHRRSSSSGSDSSSSDATPSGSPGPKGARPHNPLAAAPSLGRATSEDSSDAAAPSWQLPVMMPPAMYGRPPPPRVSPHGPQFGQASSPSLDKTSMRRGMSITNRGPLGAGGAATGAAAVPTSVVTVVPPPPYLGHSCTGDCLWGYPFSGPRTSVLFTSKRSRRHRTLLEHLATARAALHAAQKAKAARRGWGTGMGAAGGQLLASAGYRLDTPEFWRALPGPPQHWQELTGPADPLLLRGTVRLGAQAGAAAGGAAGWCGAPAVVGGGGGFGEDDAALVSEDSLVVVLEITNRMSVEVSGVELLLRTAGPLLLERRGMAWELPRLAPGQRATRTVQLRVLGHAPGELHPALQLCVAVLPGDASPVQLHCQALRVPMQALLRPLSSPPPLGPSASVSEFFRTWSTLPARATLPGVCAWPGTEGQVLALSALLRQPLSPVLLQHLPASGAHQAALHGVTLAGHAVQVLVFMQLQPPALASGSPGSSQSAVQLCVRSSCQELIAAVQLHIATFLDDLTGGTVLPGVTAPGQLSVGRTKPPVDARAAALHHAYLAAAAPAAPAPSNPDPVVPVPAASVGPKVSHTWLRSAALSEWQRLVA